MTESEAIKVRENVLLELTELVRKIFNDLETKTGFRAQSCHISSRFPNDAEVSYDVFVQYYPRHFRDHLQFIRVSEED